MSMSMISHQNAGSVPQKPKNFCRAASSSPPRVPKSRSFTGDFLDIMIHDLLAGEWIMRESTKFTTASTKFTKASHIMIWFPGKSFSSFSSSRTDPGLCFFGRTDPKVFDKGSFGWANQRGKHFRALDADELVIFGITTNPLLSPMTRPRAPYSRLPGSIWREKQFSPCIFSFEAKAPNWPTSMVEIWGEGS